MYIYPLSSIHKQAIAHFMARFRCVKCLDIFKENETKNEKKKRLQKLSQFHHVHLTSTQYPMSKKGQPCELNYLSNRKLRKYLCTSNYEARPKIIIIWNSAFESDVIEITNLHFLYI